MEWSLLSHLHGVTTCCCSPNSVVLTKIVGDLQPVFLACLDVVSGLRKEVSDSWRAYVDTYDNEQAAGSELEYYME